MLFTTLQRHNTENSKQVFPVKELRGYSSNFYIHVSVIDLCIPLIGLPILLLEIGGPNEGIYRSQFFSREYINPNFFAVHFVTLN
jgi:hypothetical protein